MASLFTKTERGREVRMLQVLVPGRGRKTLRLGAVGQRSAERFRDKVEALVACRRMNQEPDSDLLQWVIGLAEDLHAGLAAAGLVQPRAPLAAVPTLGRFLEKYIAAKRGQVAPRSIELLEQTAGRLIAQFGSATLLDRITADGARDWREGMLGRLAEATVRLHTRNAKSIFNDAIERELIDRSPFRKLPSAAVPAQRDFFLPLVQFEAILPHLPDREHRLLFGLARLAGLRVPSETHLLEWGHVDWDRRRLTVHAPKTGATRQVPIVPRLMELLADAYEHRERGFEQVLLMTTNNIHRTLIRAIEAAGLERWPDLYQNLRRNAETDFAAKVPDHVAAAFLGHGVGVSRKFYLQVQPEMFDVVSGTQPDSALHLALQHCHAPGRTGPQRQKRAKRGGSADAA